jgi:hypothetical protein
MHEIQQIPTAREKTEVEMNIELAKRGREAGGKAVEEIQTLAERLMEAHQALNDACGRFRADTITWMKEEIPQTLKEIRDMKMAFTADFSQLQKQLSELRKFFIGPVYDSEISRLRDFVELVERLQKLKDSGFLDTVADTMLKLA